MKKRKNEPEDLNGFATGFETECEPDAATGFAPGAETDATDQIEPRGSCVFYTSWYEAINQLPQKDQLNAYKMIFDYALNFKEPDAKDGVAYAIFIMAKPLIEKAEDRYNESVEKGKKGGRPSVIDKDKVLRLHFNGMKPSEIAEKLGYNRDSVKSVIYRNKGANANLYVYDNVYENDNDNLNIDDDKDVSSKEENKIDADAQEIASLFEEQKEKVIECYEKGMSFKKSNPQIQKATGLDGTQIYKIVTSYEEEKKTQKTTIPDKQEPVKEEIETDFDMDIDFKSKTLDNNDRIKHIIKVKIQDLIDNQWSQKEDILEDIVDDMTSYSYQCDKEAVKKYVNGILDTLELQHKLSA